MAALGAEAMREFRVRAFLDVVFDGHPGILLSCVLWLGVGPARQVTKLRLPRCFSYARESRICRISRITASSSSSDV